MKPLTFHMRRVVFSLTALLCLAVWGNAPAAPLPAPTSDVRTQAAREAPPTRAGADELTLEKLFPRDGAYVPGASGIAVAHDGRYAAYLYRPFDERYLWDDLWIRDLATGKTIRLSPVARKDPAAAKQHNRDYFIWSPRGTELLYVCGSKLYRWKEGDSQLTEETAISGFIQEVQYLPNGAGYTCVNFGTIRKVIFGQAGNEPVRLQVPLGEELYWYQVSPDGQNLAFLTVRQAYKPGGPRTVKIAVYQGRFMGIKVINRPVAEDAPALDVNVYVADMGSANSTRQVHHHVYTGPCDTVSQPSWSPDSRKIAFSVFEQTTRQVRVLQADLDSAPGAEKKPAQEIHRFAHTGGPSTPRMIQPIYLDDSCRLVFVTEQTGYRHLHVLDPRLHLLEPLTTGQFEVYPLALSLDRRWYYVAATREDPACRDIYRVCLATGQMERLSGTRGVYGDIVTGERIGNIAVSPDGRTVLANFACFGTPRQLVRIDAIAGTQETLLDFYPESVKQYTNVRPEFFTYKNRQGQEIHGYMFKPPQWKPTDKRPLLVYVYGGPLGIRKVVSEGDHLGDSYYFAYYMAARHGYVTCVIDPRGSSGYGAEFEKANFEQPGRPQVDDLVDGVRFLVKNHGVDPKRVGIHGWSFGGFQTQMCMYLAPDVFTVGIAGAGPTEWENYNGWYTTGTIGASRPGQPDLGKFSLLPLAKNLKGHLLLVHGMEDDNVLFQDTIKVYRALLQAGKETQVELFLDPTGNHWLSGDVTQLARFRKYEDFLVRHLGEGV